MKSFGSDKVRMFETPFTIEEAKRIIHDEKIVHSADKGLAATTLMLACENSSLVSLNDMLRCLDYGGTIAEMGARGLYVRTGRDGLIYGAAGSNGKPYIIDRTNWESYLQNHNFLAKG